MEKREYQNFECLPLHLMENIFFRLPAKIRARFRCVSKAWQALLSDPCFEKRRLTTHGENLFLTFDYKFYKLNIKLRENNVINGGNNYSTLLRSLNFPPTSPIHGYKIAGSCDSLVCLRQFHDEALFLFNPYTCEHKELPCPAEFSHVLDQGCYGLGYDSSTDDYKLLKCLFRTSYRNSITMLYSLKHNSWKAVQSFPLQEVVSTAGVYTNGALHWLAKNKNAIMCFTLADEHFHNLPLLCSRRMIIIDSLTTLNGRICIACRSFPDAKYVELWMMNIYMVRQSWTNLINNIPADEFPENQYGYNLSILCIIKNEEVLLQKWNRIAWFHSRSNTFKDVQISIPGIDRTCVLLGATSYVESFMPLNM